MRATLLSVLTVSVMALPAAAQPVVPLPGAPMNWQGFYAGLTAGLGSSKLTFDDDGWWDDGIQSDRDSGFLFGAYAGYNVLLTANWLAGVEVDWTHLSGKRSIAYSLDDTYASGDAGSKVSLRGRLGYVVDRALFYGTAGIAFGNPEAHWSSTDGIGYSAKETKWKTGFIGGAGVEYGLTSNVLVRLEGLYTQYGWHDAPNDYDDDYHMRAKNADFTVRAGIAYKF